MKKLFAMCVAAGLMLGTTSGNSASAEDAKLKLAVIPKGTTHIFWKSVEAGAKQAAAELNVDIVWKGPVKEDDRAQQIEVVDSFVSQGVNGIVLAPLDQKALLRPVQAAGKKNIPVVIIDSPLAGEAGKDFASLVATDNKTGGAIAGKELARILGGKGKVVLLRYLEGSASTSQREEGFLEAAKAGGLEILSSNKYSGATAAEAQQAALNLAEKLKEADGVFASNEPSSLGILQAIRQLKLAGKIKFIGFDASKPLLDGMNNGEIQGLVAQNPRRMGYLGVKTIVAAIKGEKVETSIDTGCVLITKENIDSTEVKETLGNQ